MILPIQILNDLNLTRTHKLSKIDKNDQCQNACHIQYDYQSGQQVLILADSKKSSKLAPRTEGPYTIKQVHVNGTLIALHRCNHLECINIHCVKPDFCANQGGAIHVE